MSDNLLTKTALSDSRSVISGIAPKRTALSAATTTLARSLPTLLVVVCLVAVAYWGEHTEWKAPKFSYLFGGQTESDKEDWCAEHGVPDSKCIKCRPELVGENSDDWCKEHGAPESRCPICHPETLTKGVAPDWCNEHGVPESNCTVCRPGIAVRSPAPAGTPDPTVVRVMEDAVSSEESAHQAAEQSGKDPVACQTHRMRVQFASPESVEKAGINLGTVVERPMSETLDANAETDYDRTRLAQVSSRAPGVAWWVGVEVGDQVRRGDVLALVDSAEVGRAKAELLTVAAQLHVRAQALDRTRALLSSKVATEADLQEGEGALRESEIRLFNARQALINLGFTLPRSDTSNVPNERELQLLGVPQSIREKVDPSNTTANLLPITAPLDGVIITRNIVAGEAVDISRPMLTVADTRRMWVMISVPQSQAGQVTLGQPLRFRAERSMTDAARGTITWISTAVDDQTRTVQVRGEVDNAEGRLLAGMFGRATITIRESPTVVALPEEAVQWDGCCNVVFVRVTDEIFQPRKVRIGARGSGFSEALVGVLPGEVVATTGSHVLISELFKSNLGVGCAGE